VWPVPKLLLLRLTAGYPNRFRAGNAASSMWAAQNGDPANFGAGYNPYIGGRKLMSQQAVQSQQSQGTWVGTDAPSFNAASMGWYQGECSKAAELFHEAVAFLLNSLRFCCLCKSRPIVLLFCIALPSSSSRRVCSDKAWCRMQ
jgi:hypothetical protein